MTVYDAGSGPELYVGGVVEHPSFASPGLLRWNGSSWGAVGTGLLPLTAPVPIVYELCVYDAGTGPELYVAGDFTTPGTPAIQRFARWDGSTWRPVAPGIAGEVYSMTVWDDGSGSKLYVGRWIHETAQEMLESWDGTNWTTVVSGILPFSMLPFDDGRGPALILGFGDSLTPGWMSRWDGQSLSSLGGEAWGRVNAMSAHDDGSGHGPDLYAVGDFYQVGGGIYSVHIGRWIRCAGPIDSFCPGDSTLKACPCANRGSSGHGCRNSAVIEGALLTPFGDTSPDTLRFASSGELASSLTILLQGSAPTATVLAFGDGLRCTGGNLLRLYVTNAQGGTANVPGLGSPSISDRSASLGDPLSAGMIRLYQAYYRDPVSPCGSFFNSTNGVRVVW